MYLDGEGVPALLDGGSQVSTVTQEYANHRGWTIHPLDQLTVSGMGKCNVPYVGYTEAHLQLTSPMEWESDVLFLVLVEDDTACVIGTNVLHRVAKEADEALIKQSPHWRHALMSQQMEEMESPPEWKGLSGLVKVTGKTIVQPGEALILHGAVRLPHVLSK